MSKSMCKPLLLLLLSVVVLSTSSTLAQTLYQRPATLAADCLPSTPQTTTFAAVFPNSSFLSGTSSAIQGQSTTVTVAKLFQVKYFPAYKEVTNTAVNETYILYQCGGTPPSGQVTAGKRVFSIPLSSLMVPDTVPNAFLSLLNVTDRVQSVSALSVTPCAQRVLSCNKTAIDISMLSNTTVLNSEVLPYVDGVTATAPMVPLPPITAPVFTVSASQDPGLLNRAEWIKFLGLFFNKEKAASDHFDTVVKSFNAVKAKAQLVKKPLVVAWISHFVYAPDEYYQISFAPFKMQTVKDAGGVNLVQADVAKAKGVTLDSFSNTTLDFAWNGTQKGFSTQAEARAAFAQALSKVDVLVDETYAIDPTAYSAATFSSQYGFTAAQEKLIPALSGSAPQVIRVDGLVSPTGGLDWYDGAIAKPVEVLTDMVGALAAPSSKTRNFIWLRNIQQNPVVITDAQCTALKSCNTAPTPLCPLVKECPDGTVVNLKPTGVCTYQDCTASSSRGTPSGVGGSTAATAPTQSVAPTRASDSCIVVARRSLVAAALLAACWLTV